MTNSISPHEAYPRLEGERVALRALGPGDVDFLFREWSDPDVTRFMRDEPPLKSREEAEAWVRPLATPEKMPTFKWWGIELKSTLELVGTCGYFRWDKQHRRAETGYDLWKAHWGKGLMPEAIAVLIRYGFTGMNLHRIEATTHTGNARSQRVLEKLGFQREGILRDFYQQDGIYNDQVLFSLLRPEWESADDPTR